MDKIKTATALFKEGFNCTQSLLAVYGVDFGINHETALKLGSAFGGGMGRMGETCGAVTGAFMIIGLKYGVTDVKDRTSKMKVYEFIEKFVKEFKARYNSIVCRELIGFDIGLKKDLTTDDLMIISQQCPDYVTGAAEILENII